MDKHSVISSVGLPVAAAVLGSIATAPGTKSRWYQELEKPSFQPPALVFPIAWSVLYTQTAVGSGIAQAHLDDAGRSRYRRKLAVNMALNAGWCWSFFRARQVGGSVLVAGMLAVSTVDLARAAGKADRSAGGFLVPYAGWTAFATLLNASIWRRNR